MSEVNGRAREALADWLVVAQAPGVGAQTFARLLGQFGNPTSVLAAPRSRLRQAGLDDETVDYLGRAHHESVAHELTWQDEPDNHILTLADAAYPRLLREIPDPPPVLYVRGRLEVLSDPQLAVVGSRNPTVDGRRNAHDFAAHLSRAGLAITSGLALGIDAAAHQAALEAGGSTVAVMATGLDRVYPARHRALAHQIAEAGALVSEFPLGAAPLRANFPRRNRVLSGLCLGTLVAEAGTQSGSLITARCALEQGREVFAIPGSIHNPLSRGCHRLIRAGAKLVETADDVFEELQGLGRLALEDTEGMPPPTHEPLSQEYRQLLDFIGYDPTSMDVLVARSGLTPDAVSSMLLVLELEGYVVATPGGRYARRSREDH